MDNYGRQPALKKPNFVVIMSDDQGYGDLSCMGATDFRTPHLDRLAESGARCTDFYSNSPVCSPSRTSLLTGRYPANAGVRSILYGYRTTPGLTPEVPTSAALLRAAGYRTALVGKWHLGMARGSRPEDHGFEDSFGFLAGSIDYFSHIHYGPNNRKVKLGDTILEGTPLHDLWENGREVWRDGHYFTALVTDKAVSYIREHGGADQPFYLHVAYNAPHFPMHAPAKYKERFPHLPWDRQIMAAMLSAMDDGVGAILDELERQGQRDNTFVVFMSDNGPSREIRNWLDGRQDPYYGGTTGRLKGHKFSLFEGGIRVPGIMSWPARIPPGQLIREPMVAMDLLPTFLASSGEDPRCCEFDGVDVSAVLTSQAPSPHGDIFWEQGRQTAIRRGKWKLVLNGQLVEEEAASDSIFLSDLEADMGERTNLVSVYPEVVTELKTVAEEWRRGIEDVWAHKWLPRIPDYSTHAHPAFLH